ncbi:MAG: hypothetical protein ABEL51_16010 [Salinibacter sp.]
MSALTALLDGEHAALRDRIRTLLQDPVFRYRPDLDTPAYRDQVLDWCRPVADQGLVQFQAIPLRQSHFERSAGSGREGRENEVTLPAARVLPRVRSGVEKSPLGPDKTKI